MRHPFVGLEPKVRVITFVVTASVSLGLVILLGIRNRRLVTAQAPRGANSLQMAATLDEAKTAIKGWNETQTKWAREDLYIDYALLLAYPLALSLACIALGSRLGGGWARFGMWAAWFALFALPADGLENLGLLRLLSGGLTLGWHRFAYVCTRAKWGAILGALLYLLPAGIRSLGGLLVR